MLLSGVEEKIEKLRQGGSRYHKHVCDCLPLCNSMYHTIETFSSPWPWKILYPDAKG